MFTDQPKAGTMPNRRGKPGGPDDCAVNDLGRLTENRPCATVRHSGKFLAGIQTRAAVGLRCAGFRPKACRNDGGVVGQAPGQAHTGNLVGSLTGNSE
jgi:hypothetical protein